MKKQLLFAASMLVLVCGMSTSVFAQAPVSGGTNVTPDDDYWTPERMRNAKPMPFPGMEERRAAAEKRLEERAQKTRERFEERKVGMQQRHEEARERMETRHEELRTQWEDRKAQLSERHKQNIKNHIERIVQRMEAAVERLTKLADKIEARLSRLEEEGADVASLRLFLEEARSAISRADATLDTAALELRSAPDTDNPAEVIGNARIVLQDVKMALREAHAALVEVVVEIKKGQLIPKEDESNL